MRNKTWIFDLDDTLHHASGGIFAHISHAMSAYMMKHLQVDAVEARLLRERYWAQYGATMHGLVTHHNIDPHDFLLETHKLEELEQWLFAEHNLAESLRALPGRKVIFSNGPHHYVAGILQRLAIERHFHSIYGVEQLDYVPKPHISAFRKVLAQERLDPRHCIMVEDSLPNLLTAKKLGMKTIWVSKQVRRPAHVDIRIASIGELARRRWD